MLSGHCSPLLEREEAALLTWKPATVAVSYPYWQFAMDMARHIKMHFQLFLAEVSRALLTAMASACWLPWSFRRGSSHEGFHCRTRRRNTVRLRVTAQPVEDSLSDPKTTVRLAEESL